MNAVLMRLWPYAKAIVGGIIAAYVAWSTARPDGITNQEWIAVGIAFLSNGVAVFLVPNFPPAVARYGKAIVGFIVTVASAVGTALAGGQLLSTNLVIQLAVAAILNSGVIALVPNLGQEWITDPNHVDINGAGQDGTDTPPVDGEGAEQGTLGTLDDVDGEPAGPAPELDDGTHDGDVAEDDGDGLSDQEQDGEMNDKPGVG